MNSRIDIGMLLVLLAGSSIWAGNGIGFNQKCGTLEPTLEFKTIDGKSVPFQNGLIEQNGTLENAPLPYPMFEAQPYRTTFSLAGEWKKERFDPNYITGDTPYNDDRKNDISLNSRTGTAYFNKSLTGYEELVEDADGRHLPDFNDNSWQNKQIPSVENGLGGMTNGPEEYQDGVWYRRKFIADRSWEDLFVKLNFISVSYLADVWINGSYVGYHEGAYTPFAFDISKHLKYGEENSIAVRVEALRWNKGKKDGFETARLDFFPWSKGDWWNYVGIIHDVYLEISDPLNIPRVNITPNSYTGDLTADVYLDNRSDQNISDLTLDVEILPTTLSSVEQNILSPDAKAIISSESPLTSDRRSNISLNKKGTNAYTFNMSVSGAAYWYMYKNQQTGQGGPNLYVLKATLTNDKNEVVDKLYTQFGFRTLEIGKDDGLLHINKVVAPPLVGAARHEDSKEAGRTMTMLRIYNSLQKLKSINANFTRTGHYPNHPLTYILTDRMGISTQQEIPNYWNDVELAWAHQEKRRIAYQMFHEMVLKDFNRPSIWFWGTGNENIPETVRLKFNRDIVAEYRDNFNDGRLVFQTTSADRTEKDNGDEYRFPYYHEDGNVEWRETDSPYPSWDDPSTEPLDCYGFTAYFWNDVWYAWKVKGQNPKGFDSWGWYAEVNSQTEMVPGHQRQLQMFIKQARRSFPHKPIMATEFGCWNGTDNGWAFNMINAMDNDMPVFESYFPYRRYDGGKPEIQNVRLFEPSWGWKMQNYLGSMNQGAIQFPEYKNPQTNQPERGYLQMADWWCLEDWYTQREAVNTLGLYTLDGKEKFNNRNPSQGVTQMMRDWFKWYKIPLDHSDTKVGNISTKKQNAFLYSPKVQQQGNKLHINFNLPHASKVEVKIFSLLGREIGSFATKGVAGLNSINLTQENRYATGLYLIRFKVKGTKGDIFNSIHKVNYVR